MQIVELARVLRSCGWPGCDIPDDLLWRVERILDDPQFCDEADEHFVARALDAGWRAATKQPANG